MFVIKDVDCIMVITEIKVKLEYIPGGNYHEIDH